MNKGETLLFCPWRHSRQCWQVSACQSFLVFLHTLKLSESIFFFSLKPIPSSSEHIDLQSCTHSSYSSWCFCLQASPSHYFYIGHSVLTADANHASCKCISKALSLWCFTHRKITPNPSCSIDSRSWFNFTASQKFKNFSKSTCIFNPSPCSLFTSEKRSFI